MHFRRPVLTFALLAAHAAWGQQPPAPFANQERDTAAISIARDEFVVRGLARECLAVVGRPESPQQFVTTWRERNTRFVAASAKYLDLRLEQAAASGPERRAAALAELQQVVRAGGDTTLRSLLQGRKEDACMRVITLLDAGAFDITPRLPQYEQLEALVRWAEK